MVSDPLATHNGTQTRPMCLPNLCRGSWTSRHRLWKLLSHNGTRASLWMSGPGSSGCSQGAQGGSVDAQMDPGLHWFPMCQYNTNTHLCPAFSKLCQGTGAFMYKHMACWVKGGPGALQFAQQEGPVLPVGSWEREASRTSSPTRGGQVASPAGPTPCCPATSTMPQVPQPGLPHLC